mgnify:CR=1 FL=1
MGANMKQIAPTEPHIDSNKKPDPDDTQKHTETETT